MGVPAFFRWLTRKYGAIVVECNEEIPGDNEIVDSCKPNPNGVEFDNLYLDMNGIIHPCTHPEDKPPPKNEEEMMIAIFECIDRIINIVRPRKILYMAIDGVAPRAKMNQQRSRRFRAAKEVNEKADLIDKIRAELMGKNVKLPPCIDKADRFDSNCITPGTSFMDRLSECLNYYIHDRLMRDKGWKGLKVLLSDASVPGEGEHKLIDFIRRQRTLPNYDPNTHHCLCGADADLIMLGLGTHELNFTIIREEFKFNNTITCDICNGVGHEMKDCKGIDEPAQLPTLKDSKYIFVRLNVLREYLQHELLLPDLNFPYCFERALDDWIFMCFFAGNDFLPHLPSIQIREGAIDRLINIYKELIYKMDGFVTDSGDLNLQRVQMIVEALAKSEDEIFQKRFKSEVHYRTKQKQNESASACKSYNQLRQQVLSEILDDVKLHEPGYKVRYYSQKFNLHDNDISTRRKIGYDYLVGLCWVLKYYYQGCVSWNWYYPHHYAPFASDFLDFDKNPEFDTNTKPFLPLEQLMGVFPAASGKLVPPSWAALMTDPLSPILDFYPKDFIIDLNGSRFAWQGVALLPFVDEKRLREGLEEVYKDLTEKEKQRNKEGNNRLYFNVEADCYDFVKNLNHEVELENLTSKGITGLFFSKNEDFHQGRVLNAPILGLKQVQNNTVLCVYFIDPIYPDDHKFLAHRLKDAIEPPKVLNKPFTPLLPHGSLTSALRMIRHQLPSTHDYIPLGVRAPGGAFAHRPGMGRGDDKRGELYHPYSRPNNGRWQWGGSGANSNNNHDRDKSNSDRSNNWVQGSSVQGRSRTGHNQPSSNWSQSSSGQDRFGSSHNQSNNWSQGSSGQSILGSYSQSLNWQPQANFGENRYGSSHNQSAGSGYQVRSGYSQSGGSGQDRHGSSYNQSGGSGYQVRSGYSQSGGSGQDRHGSSYNQSGSSGQDRYGSGYNQSSGSGQDRYGSNYNQSNNRWPQGSSGQHQYGSKHDPPSNWKNYKESQSNVSRGGQDQQSHMHGGKRGHYESFVDKKH